MADYNIRDWKLPADIAAIYPPHIARPLVQLFALTVQPVPARETRVDWTPLLAFADRWKRRYHANLGRPGILYLDGGDFLSVSARGGGDGNDLCIALADEYREVYLACIDQARSTAEIAGRLPKIPRSEVVSILEELDSLGILFSGNGQHLALALRERNVGNYPFLDLPAAAERPLPDREDPARRSRMIVLNAPRSA